MISILITAWKEDKTIGKSIETFISGYKGDFELLLAIPDHETKTAALKKVTELGINNKTWFSDMIKDGKPKGKPAELNYLIDKAKGDILFFGDGDVYYKKNNIEKMLAHFNNPKVMAVTGRPKSSEPKNTMMEYFGNLLADAAHHKRTVELTKNVEGHDAKFVRKINFFPVSGYLFAMRKTDIRAPEDTLVEDAYFSYAILNNDGIIEYEPEAVVYVKYPSTLSDYFKQKKRSAGGYVQLWKYGVVKPETKSRSFWLELEYFWFPITYASNIKELLWSLLLYPIRLWQWILIHWEQKVVKKDFFKTWVRIESTK